MCLCVRRYGYDAVWMAAFILNRSIARLNELNHKLEDFTYRHRHFTDIFLEESKNVSFQGVSVSVSMIKPVHI